MNFLSHFYLDRHSRDPNFVIGSILPDLVKNVRKDWNFHPHKNPSVYSSPELQSLLSGWKRHLEIDKQFHSSAFFSNHTATLRTAIAPVLENSPIRPSFVAHIALELMLDSLLLKEELIDAHELYSSIALSNRNSLNTFLLLNKADDPDLFFNFLDEFIKQGYLHSYRESSNILYAINRVCLRIWPDPLSETQKLQLTALLPEYQEQLQPSFLEIFEQLESSEPVS